MSAPVRRRDRGAALLELAIIAPVLLLLAFGVAEFGYQWVAANRVASAVATAARVASTSGSVADADRNILLTLQASLPASMLDDVVQVVIFQSNANGDIAPPCADPATPEGNGQATGALRCNVYDGARLTQDLDAINFDALDNNWEPESRRDRLVHPPDYIGVRVVVTSSTLTNTFWGDQRIIRQSIYRIAPDFDG